MSLYNALDDFAEEICQSQLGDPQWASTPDATAPNNFPLIQGSNVKLPKITLPTFSGHFGEWIPFKESFVSLVKDNKTLDNLSQLHFLKSSVNGEARDLICKIQLTSANFEVAWELLSQRYDNKRAIVSAYVNTIFALQPIKKESASTIANIRNTVHYYLSALKNLGRPTEFYDDLLINRIVLLLDPKTQRDWVLRIAVLTEIPQYSEPDGFLLERIRVLESIETTTVTSSASQRSGSTGGKDNPKFQSVKAHVVTASKCPLCKSSHSIYRCPEFQGKNSVQKYETVKSLKVCVDCLQLQHKSIDYPSKFSCFNCKKKHHTSLHMARAPIKEKESESDASHSTLGIQVSNTVPVQTHFSKIDAKKSASVVLATARVLILSPTGRAAQVRALLDQGLYISLRFLILSVRRCIPGLGGVCAGIASSSTEIRISPWVDAKTSLVTNSLVVPRITDYVPYSNITLSKLPHLQGLQLVDDLTNSDPIHLLIGADLYGSVFLDGLKKGFTGDPVAQNTIFGWVVSGP